MVDYFYYREHLFIVSELLKENLYEFGKYVRDSRMEPYFTLPRLKKITKQVCLKNIFVYFRSNFTSLFLNAN